MGRFKRLETEFLGFGIPEPDYVKNIKSGEGICKAREEEVYSSYLSLTPESETSVGCLGWVSYCKARNKRYFL